MPAQPAPSPDPRGAGPVAEPFPRLHAPSVQEELVDAGRCRRPDGAVERYSVHRDPEGRHLVRVAVAPAEGEAPGAEGPWTDPVAGVLPAPSLWHLVLAPDGRPERMEARWSQDGSPVELALTFFPDEVLLWRRGAEPAAESLALPPGFRLLWPPVSGREACLTGLDTLLDAEGRGLLMVCALGCRPAARGGLRARPVKLGLSLAAPAAADPRDPSTAEPAAPPAGDPSGAVELTLSTPGWPPQRLSLDPAGRLSAWQVGEDAVTCRRPWLP